MSHRWAGLDLGATNAKASIVSENGEVLASNEVPLGDDRSPAAVAELLCQCCSKCLDQLKLDFADLDAIGVGCPGKVDGVGGIVEGIANFPWPPSVPLAQLVQDRTGRPVYLTNDADAVVAAENWVGIGNRMQNFVVITLGSGVGCGIVIDGEMIQGSSGNIEGGHMLVQAEGGRPCGCGSSGCLEAYTSANSVARLATEALEDREDESSLRSIMAEGKTITCRDVFEAAKKGDALSIAVVDRVARVLAVGCINLSRIVDTDSIAFTGGMVAAGEFLLDKVRAAVKAQTWTCLPTPFTIQQCEAGPAAGTIGAAAVARIKHTRSNRPSQAPASKKKCAISRSALLASVGAVVLAHAVGFYFYSRRNKTQ